MHDNPAILKVGLFRQLGLTKAIDHARKGMEPTLQAMQ